MGLRERRAVRNDGGLVMATADVERCRLSKVSQSHAEQRPARSARSSGSSLSSGGGGGRGGNVVRRATRAEGGEDETAGRPCFISLDYCFCLALNNYRS